MRILVHCNGGPDIGVGHVVRSVALAEEAVASGHEVTFVGEYGGEFLSHLLETTGAEVRRIARSDGAALADEAGAVAADVLHLDTYDELTPPHVPGLLVSNLEDGEFGRRACDLAVDPNFGAETEPTRLVPTRAYLRGSRYTPLRASVVARRGEWQLRDEATRVLVVMGGADPRRLTPRVLDVLGATGLPLQVTAVSARDVEPPADLPPGMRVEVVRPVDDLPALMVQQDLVISAAGTSVWELCCLGVPMALVCAVDNQRAGYDRVVAADAAIGLGSTLEGEEADRAARDLRETLTNPATRLVLARQARHVVDGLGAWRIVRAWEQLVRPSETAPRARLDVRRATLDDAERLLSWRNDPQTQAASRHTGVVLLADHLAWLESSLADDKRLLLVASDPAADVGTVRWDQVEPGVWEVSITVAPERRGEGLARPLLDAGERALREAVDDLRAVDATVHSDNAASQRLFTAAGYLPDRPADEGGFLRFRKVLRP